MLRHDFRPGKLVAGLFLTAAGVVYLGDAGNAWQTPWFVVIPLVADTDRQPPLEVDDHHVLRFSHFDIHGATSYI